METDKSGVLFTERLRLDPLGPEHTEVVFEIRAQKSVYSQL